MATYVNDSLTFDRLLSSGIPVIAKFSGKQCPPCIQNAPIFDHAAQTNGKKAHFIVVDSQEGGALFQRYGVRSMPTFIYFHNGTEKNRVTGASSFNSDVASFLTKYGKTVFDMSKGKALGSIESNAPEETKTGTEAEAKPVPRQPNANNPWANRNFNPSAKMKENENKNKFAAAAGDDLGLGDAGEAPAGMVCENGVCRVVESGQQEPKKSVCQSTCNVM